MTVGIRLSDTREVIFNAEQRPHGTAHVAVSRRAENENVARIPVALHEFHGTHGQTRCHPILHEGREHLIQKGTAEFSKNPQLIRHEFINIKASLVVLTPESHHIGVKRFHAQSGIRREPPQPGFIGVHGDQRMVQIKYRELH